MMKITKRIILNNVLTAAVALSLATGGEVNRSERHAVDD
jgi:hypothetical protein